MSENTPIEWTDDSWNPIRAKNKETGGIGHFCVKVSPGCKECYAELFQPRMNNPVRYATQDAEKVEIFIDYEVAERPLRRKRPRKIFPCSMTDLFGEFVTDDMIATIFAYMAYARPHTFQVTTKRADRMFGLMTSDRFADLYHGACTMVHDIACEILGHRGEFDANARRTDDIRAFDPAFPLKNVWLGSSVEDQKRADERRPAMEKVALEGWLTWVSNEPSLEAINWNGWEFLRWFVAGGESGPRARPSHPDFHRGARDWCAANHIPFFFKQHGAWVQCETEVHADERGREVYPIDESLIEKMGERAYKVIDAHGVEFVNVGKKTAGRVLDGRTHDEYPA